MISMDLVFGARLLHRVQDFSSSICSTSVKLSVEAISPQKPRNPIHRPRKSSNVGLSNLDPSHAEAAPAAARLLRCAVGRSGDPGLFWIRSFQVQSPAI